MPGSICFTYIAVPIDGQMDYAQGTHIVDSFHFYTMLSHGKAAPSSVWSPVRPSLDNRHRW